MKLSAGLIGLLAVVLTACTSCATATGGPSGSAATRSVGTDREITFTSGRLTVHGSLRMPDGAEGAVPAMLLVAGSGPTDRNGDSTAVAGSIGTLRYLADVLARKGIASLRYDKFASGQTGFGPYQVADIASLTFDEYLHEAADGVNFLAAQPGIDRSAIGIAGHSEGGLIALAVANGKAGPVPALTSLSLLEPATDRILDTLSRQFTANLVQAEQAGAITSDVAAALRASLVAVVEQLRTSGTLPGDVPQPLQNFSFTPANAKMLATEDLLDPVALASALRDPLRIFTSCSDKDIQIGCDGVARLDDALKQTALRTVHLTSADHMLKDVGDQPSTGAEYGQPLPFSQQLTDAWNSWLPDQ